MASEGIFGFSVGLNSANSNGGSSFCASVVEEVLQQHNAGLSDVNLASRRAEESVARRYQAAGWLKKMVGIVGSRDLPHEPSEEEFLLGLRNGLILCNVLNKVHPGAVPKVVENPVDSVYLPDGAALSAYQYFENVRNFLVAIQEMGLPTFEASDLEKGGSCIKVVNSVLALKSYGDWKQSGANGSWKFGSSLKPPIHGRCMTRVGKNFEPFMRNAPHMDSNGLMGQSAHFGSDVQGSGSHSLDMLVRALLSERKPEEVPIVVESMLTKVTEEFERRLASQSEQIQTVLKNLVLSDDKRSLSEAKILAALCSGNQPKNAVDGNSVGGLVTSDQQEKRDQISYCTSISKEEYESRMQKQQALFNLQQQEIRELKHVLQTTRTHVQFMQSKCSEEFHYLGRHLQDLTQAASGYHKVLEENRQLYNQVQDLKGSIRVYCRVRPFLPGQQSGLCTVDYIGDGNITISNPMKQEKGSRRSFNFNKVFGPSASQEEVFCDTQPLIRSVLDGYNVCIFAYGQTGSGKTYTMTGPKQITVESQGVNYRALSDLFHISEQRKDVFVYDISVQMIEIYNEQVRDLLVCDNSKRLEIRNSSQQNGFNVPDANLVPVTSTSEVIELMNIGQKNRAVGATALNDRSSRSHSCLTVHVQGRDAISGAILRGCLHLVDLAGSERVDKSEATGERLKEAQHINKSLSALGDVIAALAQKNSHIPYRNSKLTQLLQDSLGGQAKTLMFVHISPEVDAIGETMSTLKFAERVSTVELGAARINKETGEIRELREQIASLKAALARREGEPDQSRNKRCSPERQTPKYTTPSPRLRRQGGADMQGSHSSHRQPMEDVGNISFPSNASGKQRKPGFDQQEFPVGATLPLWPDNYLKAGAQKAEEKEAGCVNWVDKVMVNKQEPGDDALRCWDNDDNSHVAEMLYQRYVADLRKIHPEHYDQLLMSQKETHETTLLRRLDSMTMDDSDDIEIGTSDSSEPDLLWQFNLPGSIGGTTQSGGQRMNKTQSKLPSKSPDIRSTHGSLHSRKPSGGGGVDQFQRQHASAGVDRKRSAGKTGIHGSGK
ncbi:kinesin-like protein KIN-14F [Nymphaea colorata]|nr:kinesin-like protein KIN-14F [Nymphaea colorata]